MNTGLGNIGWQSLTVGGTPGAPTGANEGLTVDAGNVQLGVPVSAPDATKNVTVARQIDFDLGTGTLLIGSSPLAGSNIFIDPNTYNYIDGRNNGINHSTRYHFTAEEGLIVASSGAAGGAIQFNDAFPLGNQLARVGLDAAANDLWLQSLNSISMQPGNTDTVTFTQNAGLFGYGMLMRNGGDGNGLYFTDNGGVDNLFFGTVGVAFPVRQNCIGFYEYVTGDYLFFVDPAAGTVNVGSSASTSVTALLNIGNPGGGGLAQINFADTSGVVFGSTTGDLWYGDNTGFQYFNTAAGGNLSILGVTNPNAPAAIPFYDAGGGQFAKVNGLFTYDEPGAVLNVPAISTSSGAPFVLNNVVAGAAVLDGTQYVDVLIGGLPYKLALVV